MFVRGCKQLQQRKQHNQHLLLFPSMPPTPSSCYYKYLADFSLLGHVVYYNSSWHLPRVPSTQNTEAPGSNLPPAHPLCSPIYRLTGSELRLVCKSQRSGNKLYQNFVKCEWRWWEVDWGEEFIGVILWCSINLYLCWKYGPMLQCGPAMSWCWGSCGAPPVWPSSCQMCSSSKEKHKATEGTKQERKGLNIITINLIESLWFNLFHGLLLFFCTLCPVRPLWAFTYHLSTASDICLPQ